MKLKSHMFLFLSFSSQRKSRNSQPRVIPATLTSAWQRIKDRFQQLRGITTPCQRRLSAFTECALPISLVKTDRTRCRLKPLRES
ncbi:hypothetical protein CEXT_331221 [Caerostris extrusa]|uniref:Secreted protein n=1 Tax=Caerostris extrusa TaxID=172846 RepID=A0AAV4XJL9_CAEEX|nr:hypothetical protein CEXT_331221 [Caerostris extrusa]